MQRLLPSFPFRPFKPWLLVALLAACTSPPSPVDSDGQASPSDGSAAPDLATLGNCLPSCGALTPKCNPKHHCVGCLADTDCLQGNRCAQVSDSMASCVPGCSADSHCGQGKKCCQGNCIDSTSDSANCGACGVACMANHAAVGCLAGKCAFTGKCDPGWGDCDMNPANGCEANLHIDPNNCTACGMKCALPNAVQACADGCYEAACQFGFDDCNMDPKDGCETWVLADGNNCGACGQSCSKLPHASAGCMNAGCVLGSCDKGYADCNGDPKDGCEVNLLGDSMNCGQCGITCPKNLPNCVSGACGTLPPSFAMYGGIQWFKIQVNGAMTDDNVSMACKSAGLTVPCQVAGNCQYNDNLCSHKTPEMSCGNPMQGLSMSICNGQSPSGCAQLYGVYQYMGHNWSGNSACGAEQGMWCATGSMQQNRFALCIAP